MMAALKWQRIADSDGTTVMYTAVAVQTHPRDPYSSYRVEPEWGGREANRVIGYTVSLWHPKRGNEWIGSVTLGSDHYETRYGEWKLSDAKRAAQDHYNNMVGAYHTLKGYAD